MLIVTLLVGDIVEEAEGSGACFGESGGVCIVVLLVHALSATVTSEMVFAMLLAMDDESASVSFNRGRLCSCSGSSEPPADPLRLREEDSVDNGDILVHRCDGMVHIDVYMARYHCVMFS